jgi:hypothetical protein
VHAPESREGVVISRWNFGEGRLIVRGTLFTFSAHDADDLRAIQGRATTGATAAITLRDPRVGHDKMLCSTVPPSTCGAGRAAGYLASSGVAKRMLSLS